MKPRQVSRGADDTCMVFEAKRSLFRPEKESVQGNSDVRFGMLQIESVRDLLHVWLR